MQKWILIIAGIIMTASAARAQQAKTRKTVFVIVDGVPADVIETLATPVLQDIAKKGGYTRAVVGGGKGTYTQTPTISAVGYNSILTGTWVNKHNVWDNDIKAPNYNYYTIFRYLKERYPKKRTAIFSTWLDNRTRLVGDAMPATGNIRIDQHYDGLELDTVQFPHDKKGKYLDNIDEQVALKAAQAIKEEAPDLTWVYLEYTDDMGHAHGDSPEFTDAVKAADKRIGYLWKAIQYREKQFKEEWLIIITTDHGRDAKTGKGHGGQSGRERSGWIFTNAQGLNEQFKTPRASIVDIMPTIARFMQIDLPKANAWEVDGTPFTGQLSFTDPVFQYKADAVRISWTPVTKEGNLSIWMANGNTFNTGGKDKYDRIKTVHISQGSTVIKMERPGAFFKVVLEAPYNTANSWHVLPVK